MFAMLGGAAGAWGGLADLLAMQVAAGLEVVTDGRETLPAGPAAASLADDLLAGRGLGSVEAWTAAAAAAPAAGAVAAALPGPFSLARRLTSETASMGDGRLTRALADALAIEVGALGAAGCPLVRIDESDALTAAQGDAPRAFFADAHRSLVAGAASDVASIHLMLGLTGGDHEGIGADLLAGLGYASYMFDLIAGPNDWRLVARIPGDRGIVCGVVDATTASGDAPEVLVWAAHYAASTRGRGLARVGLATTGSLAGLEREAGEAKLRALGEGARIAGLPRDEIRTSLDPRALDIRSAALGSWSPDPRFERRPPR